MGFMVHKRRRTKPSKRPRQLVVAQTAYPPALVEFMMQGWKPRPRPQPAKVKGYARFAARRRALSRAFPGEVLVIPTGHEKVRANDTTWRFRPSSDFYYLTGNQEPDCVLVLWPSGKTGHEHVLYVEPNPGRTDATFFTDRNKGELWVGPRLGVPESRERYQVDRCAPLGELGQLFRELRGRRRPVRVLRGVDPDIDRALPARPPADRELATALSEMRLIKDDMEVAALKRACVATRHALDDVVRALRRAKTERELEAAFARRARIEGNDVGFNVIAAAGEHACILHWTANNGQLRTRDLVLIDAGVETNELYTGDLTRTLPVSGKFSKAQREVYDLVIEAQNAALAAVRPGADFVEPHRAATRVLAEGLVRLGVLRAPLAQALDERQQLYKRYTLHNTSHMLGLDVHDGAQARPQRYREGRLVPGMVLTIEPGLYFQVDDLTVPARLRGIGVRVEDDVLVTTRGGRLLSDVPRASDDVERWLKRLWQGA